MESSQARRMLNRLGATVRGQRSPDPGAADDVMREVELAGVRMVLGDAPGSVALDVVTSEVGQGPYDFSDIDFQPGDVAIDIGAHVGTISIWLAKAHPSLRILAFEPVPPVFERLQRNLARNDITNVTAFNMAVTADGRDLEMAVHLGSNTGGGTGHLADLDLPEHERHRVPSVTLEQIFDEHGIDRCKLLKIDCEGSEYEVLLTCRYLDRIDHLRGEFHNNHVLYTRGYSPEALYEHCERWIGEGRVRYLRCQMAE